MTWSKLLGQERFARMAWSRLSEPGDKTVVAFVRQFGPVAALTALREGAMPRGDRLALRLADLDVERDLEIADRIGARVVVPDDDEWPTGLDDLAVPPFCLWVRGRAEIADACSRSTAVVGARAATSYGQTVAGDLAAGLSDRGFSIVSGAAFGIDAAAHRGVLGVDGTTLAVLAGGVDRAYPLSHRDLLEAIALEGAVLSEVPPGCAPTPTRFLKRNRLIATMTQGTVVVEAGLRSGSLSTAYQAAEHSRVVAAMPGQVTSMVSAGCHQAIRDGVAILVTDSAEAAEAIGRLGADLAPERRGARRPEDALDEHARDVLAALPQRTSASTDVLAQRTALTGAEVLGALGQLELLAMARRDGAAWRKTPRRQWVSPL